MPEKDLKAVTDIADDENIYDTADVVTPEGGAAKKRKADMNKKVDPKADSVKESEENDEDQVDDEEEMEDDEEMEEGKYKKDMKESFAALFEGTDLSEDFKERATLVFEAAVNEAAAEKAKNVSESLEEEFEGRLTESVNEAMEDIVENLDSYLDYIVTEWMEENAVAIESGVKVEMAETFMDGLKELFAEHNVEVDEESIDVVSGLEDKLSESEEKANSAIAKTIELTEEVNSLKAEKVFDEVCEDLTTSQRERMRILSEKLDDADLDSFKTDLSTLKESFFKKEAPVVTEEVEEENEILTEDNDTNKRYSDYDSVNAIVAAINARNNK